MIEVGNGITIRDNELHFRFVRARGPGGQHVNRSSTAVQLSFNVAQSESLPDRVKQRLHRIAGGYMSGEGVILIFADRYRSQRMNRRDAVDRLVDLIRRAATPVRTRVRTRPSRSSIEQRIEAKKRRGQRKRDRRWRPRDED